MDFKSIKGEKEAVTRDLSKIMEPTGNIYESVVIMSIRANQINNVMKEELKQKIRDFATEQDNMEEINENREQIEVSRFYERLPKPTLIAIEEFLNNEIYFRKPADDK